MNDKFDLRKIVITGLGVIIFLIAGMLAMFLIPSDKTPTKAEPAQNLRTNSQPENFESQAQPLKSNWFIYVTGAVKNPGVYKVSEDSRIFHAIDAAGGFSPRADQTSINLAEHLADGVHIHVAQKADSMQQTHSTRIPGVQANNIVTVPLQNTRNKPQNSNTNRNFIDINHASSEELQKLNGIGPALAKRIIEYRHKNGNFMTPDDLLQVKGIGPAKLKKMREQILIR